ncbi:MAG: pilus assembly PilX family protein [Methylosarcina sp.]
MRKGHVLAKKQSGAVLAISLIMLLLLTLIGTTGMSVTSLEEKMAGNMRDRNLAFQAAESALVAGEIAVATATPTITCPGTHPPGYYLQLDKNCDGIKETTAIWNNSDVWTSDSNSIKFNNDNNPSSIDLVALKANPRYIIEYMGPCSASCSKRYRITARATGGSVNSVVIVQSIIETP